MEVILGESALFRLVNHVGVPSMYDQSYSNEAIELWTGFARDGFAYTESPIIRGGRRRNAF